MVPHQQEKEEETTSTVDSLPLKDIDEPRDEDVVFGRGGYSNHHPGKEKERERENAISNFENECCFCACVLVCLIG